MRMYSPDELDLMAEAYIKALDKLPVESPTTALTQRLVQEIGAGVASGIRDEDELAAAAIRRSHQLADLQKPAALSGKPERCDRPVPNDDAARSITSGNGSHLEPALNAPR